MNRYQILNYLSNYLDKYTPDTIFKTTINEYLLDSDNPSNDLEFLFIKLNIKENLNFQTNIFYKITKENIVEVLFGNNNFYFNYEVNKINICKNKPAREFLSEINIFLDINDNSVISDNEGKNGRSGLHFLPSLSNNALISNICYFGEAIVIGINEPQLTMAKENDTIKNKSNIVAFDEIYISQKYSAHNPIVFKEFLFQLVSDHNDSFSINKFYNNKYNSFFADNGFDAIIEKLKIIEIFNKSKNEISCYTQTDEIQDLIIDKLENFIPEYYIDTINFLNNAKEIYINLRKNKNFTPQSFCSSLDEICPGKLHIFDEKYQIEEFREMYGGKEFKEKFLNNLSKTAKDMPRKEIFGYIFEKSLIGKYRIKTKKEKLQNEIIKNILDYNEINPDKQIPILILVNNLKKYNEENLDKLKQIINKYIEGEVSFLYDYLIKEKDVNAIIKEINETLDDKIGTKQIENNKLKLINNNKEIDDCNFIDDR